MDAAIVDLEIAWQVHVGPADALEPVLARHREPHRRYHGTRHLVNVVRHVLELTVDQPTDDIGAVVAAACFHDAVYRGRSDGSDEAASADLAARSLAAIGWPSTRIHHVRSMITATARHTTEQDVPADRDTAILLDADLAILGADPAAYHEYVRQIRAEHPELDDDAWRAGRGAVLRSLAARAVLFHTASGRRRWDHRARANLAAEMAALAAGTG